MATWHCSGVLRDRDRLADLLLRGQGVICVREFPAQARFVRTAATQGAVTAVLPGVFVAAESAEDPWLLARALLKHDPNTVFTGRTAAGLLGREELMTLPIRATGRVSRRFPRFSLSQRVIDPEWIAHQSGFACTSPELTALDVLPELGAVLIDDLLREAREHGGEQLARLWEAFRAHPGRPGNQLRERLLRESRDLPWSEAERRAHVLLRQAGIKGWSTNVPAFARQSYFLDIAFERERVALEIDGFETHGTRDAFERDRARRNNLTLAGWTVLNFTWVTVTEQPEQFIATVRAALGQRVR